MWAKFVFICLQYVSLLVMKGRPQHCILSVPLSTKLAAWKTQWCSARSKRRYSFKPSRGAVVAITRSLERTLLTINARSVCVRARGHIVRWRLEKFRVCHHLATVWCGALGASSYAIYIYIYMHIHLRLGEISKFFETLPLYSTSSGKTNQILVSRNMHIYAKEKPLALKTRYISHTQRDWKMRLCAKSILFQFF